MAASTTEPATATDERLLLERLARGDPAAFDVLVTQHQQRVAGLVYRLLGWRRDVEDVVQDVFVAALQGLPKFRGECQLATWLFRITINECRRVSRRRWWRLSLPVADVEARPADAATGLDDDTARQVRAAVGRLPSGHREVVVLRYLEDLPIVEIGQILGLSRNAVEVRLNRARQRLKGVLAPMLED